MSTGSGQPALDPTVWPRTAALTDAGELTLAGIPVSVLAAQHATPAYLLDELDLRARASAWQQAFARASGTGAGGGTAVYYAAKAFICAAVARWIAEEGLGLDVCTGGELAVALRAGFPAERIAVHGNNKSLPELTDALDAQVGRIVIDSFEEIDRLAALTVAGPSRRQPVYLRVTPGVEAHTHEFVATGQEDQKFGFSLASGAAWEAVHRVLAVPGLELVGLHAHIGSQIFDTAGFGLAAHRLVGLLSDLRDATGITLAELGLGGGLGIAYTSEDAPLEVEEVAERLLRIVGKECATAGLPVPRVTVEPGRAISGPSTVTVYEVGTVKELPGLRTYVSVDGGMSDNIRTALYGARYTVRLAGRDSTAPLHTVTVCGKHCESGDIIAHDVALPADLRPGDLLAVPASGAYHRSMASNYNHVPRPPVIALRDGVAQVIVRRETVDDLLALDVAP